jgi:hypothetical protein
VRRRLGGRGRGSRLGRVGRQAGAEEHRPRSLVYS